MPPIGPDELGRLLDEHGPALVLYARQWCASPEDVVQEAFVQLARQSAVPDRPAAWLFRVVRNGAISLGRSSQRRKRREQSRANRGAAWFMVSEADRLDGQEVAEALETLPAEQRESIVARLWGQLSFEEIAELSGTSTSTAHRWYQAGLSALRTRFNVPCHETPARPTR